MAYILQKKHLFVSFEYPLRYLLSLAEEIAKLFPSLFGQPSASLVPSEADPTELGESLKVGVVLSGGQAPGGHNVISGIFGKRICIYYMYFVVIFLVS